MLLEGKNNKNQNYRNFGDDQILPRLEKFRHDTVNEEQEQGFP